MDNQNQIFDYALSAKKVKIFKGNKFKGEFEIDKSTPNLYKGISGLKFTITNASDEKIGEFKHKTKLYIKSGSSRHWTLQSVLFGFKNSRSLFYARNICSSNERKDLIILDFSKSHDEVTILVAPSMLGKGEWDYILNSYQNGSYDSQINELLSQLEIIER